MAPTVPPVSEADRKLANLFGTSDKALNTPVEADLIAADLALNRNKIKRADDKALRDQIMLQHLLRSSM